MPEFSVTIAVTQTVTADSPQEAQQKARDLITVEEDRPAGTEGILTYTFEVTRVEELPPSEPPVEVSAPAG